MGRFRVEGMALRGWEWTQAAAAVAAAWDDAAAREREFHNLMMGVKDQVIAQFGKDSNEVQSIGLKKASEYSRPKTRSKKGGE